MTVTNGDAAAPGGRERRALIAVNPFKGTLTGADVAAACARAARSEGYHVDVVPASDGGDGLLESLRARLQAAGPTS